MKCSKKTDSLYVEWAAENWQSHLRAEVKLAMGMETSADVFHACLLILKGSTGLEKRTAAEVDIYWIIDLAHVFDREVRRGSGDLNDVLEWFSTVWSFRAMEFSSVQVSTSDRNVFAVV